MAGGLNEVQACMHSVVNNLLTVDTVLLFEIRVEPRFNIVNDRPPTKGVIRVKFDCNSFRTLPIVVVNKVTKSWGVDNVQVKTNAVLLDVYIEEMVSNRGGAL